MSQVYSPSSLTRGIKGMLMKEIANAGASNLLGRIAMLEPSDGPSETYVWLGEAPRMRQIDDADAVIYDGMTDTSYSLTNALWKSGLVVSRKDLDDQQFPAITRRVQQLASVARRHIDRLIVQALIDGDATACYDGANFFANSHAARGQQTSAQDNLLAGTGTSVAQVQADVMDSIEFLMGVLAENNEPFSEMSSKFAVVYPTGLHGTMIDAVRGSMISNTSNARFGEFTIDLIPTARLNADDANDFYVLDVSNPSDLPLVVQQRDALEVLSLDSMTGSDDAFDREQYKYQVRWRGASGYAHWQHAAKVVNS